MGRSVREEAAGRSSVEWEGPHDPLGRLAPASSCYGRDGDLIALRGLIDQGHRLITITGPGGVGKTRFALAAGRQLSRDARVADGITFVPLASVGSDELVIPTIARALGVLAEDERPAATRLAAALHGQRRLLLIDNFEHVIAAAVELAVLLDGAPELTVLVTSRRALRLSWEQEFPLAPLHTPETGTSGSAIELARSPAVALFVARAEAANPAFALTDENAPYVAAICTRLDGLPLAIELAAARVKLLSPRALANRLTGRLQLLTSGPRDVPPRQQTLRDAIAWSYDLLDGPQQTLFRRLAVFSGGATLAAVDAVSGAPDCFDLVSALVDHSLLVQEDGADAEPRFRMLETIREFALERLEEAGEAGGAHDAHARFYLALAQDSAAVAYGREEPERLRILDPEIDNVRGALGWLLRPTATPAASWDGLRLITFLVRFFDVRGYLDEEARWLRRALELNPVAITSEHGNALTALGVHAWFTGDLESARERQAEALAIWQALGDERAIVRSLWFLGLVAGKLGDIPELLRLHGLCAPLAPRIGQTLWTQVPDALLGLAELARGDGRAAIAIMEPTARYHGEHGYRWPRAWVLAVMAEAAQIARLPARALALMQESLAEFWRVGDIYATLDALTVIALRASDTGQAEVGARMLAAATNARAAVGYRITWSTITDDEVAETLRRGLGSEAFARVTAASAGLSLDAAVKLALAVCPDAQPPEPVRAPVPSESPFGLSPREIDVLRLLTEGRSNSEIGDALFISPRTASTHVANILGKLGVSSRAAAVAIALQRQIV